MRELAEAAGVSAGTIKHYLREGLLPEPVKTSRNMAWYPREFVERVKLIKQLQEERFLPLKVIKEVLEHGGDGGRAGAAAGDDRARGPDPRAGAVGPGREGPERARGAASATGCPDEALERLEKLEVLTPRARRTAPSATGPPTSQIIEAVGRMRASGYSEALGFTVYDTLIYKRHLERLVHEEVEVMMERVAGEMDTDEAADLLERAVEPMRDLVAAMRAKLLIAELQARRAGAATLSDLEIREAREDDRTSSSRSTRSWSTRAARSRPRRRRPARTSSARGCGQDRRAGRALRRRLAGSYHLLPNYSGRAAHIGNAGYMVHPDSRQGIGRAGRAFDRRRRTVRRADVQPRVRVESGALYERSASKWSAACQA